MRTSSAVSPSDTNRASAAPMPRSRVNRKYLDRKAPKADFLRKVKWSKRRRSVFFAFTVLVFLIDIALVLYYSTFLGEHTLPDSYVSFFLGWNLLYNTQGPGTMSGDGQHLERLWRGVFFYIQVCLSAYILVFRVRSIRDHHKDIGPWRFNDTKNVILKLSRAVLVGSVVLIYFFDVKSLENPRIRNEVFLNTCRLGPTFRASLVEDQINGNQYVGCDGQQMANIDTPETAFKGQIPDMGPEGAPVDNGTQMIIMREVGQTLGCPGNTDPDARQQMTLTTRPGRACSRLTFEFSNWATFPEHDDCTALTFAQHYEKLPDDQAFVPASLHAEKTYHYDYVDQWFCNVTKNNNVTHLTVAYETAFTRASERGCTVIGDHPSLENLRPDTSIYSELSNWTDTHITSVTGVKYLEFDECTGIQVACVNDTASTPSVDAVTGEVFEFFHRSVALTGCSRTFGRSPTAAIDQRDWDNWLQDWKDGYRAAAAGQVLETAWDILEALAYIVI